MIINLPDELKEARFFTADGRAFTIAPRKKLLFTWQELKEDQDFLGEKFDLDATKSLTAEVASSLKTVVKSNLAEMVDGGASLVEPLIKKTLQDLRRSVVELGAKQLNVLFSDFFKKNSNEISAMFMSKVDGVVTTTGPIPKLVKFIWETKTNKDTYRIYCLELAPHRRTIGIKQMEDGISSDTVKCKWVMPWLCVLAIFKNNNFQFATAFYRDRPLNSADNKLLKCGLPGKYNHKPWHFCDFKSTPEVKVSDPEWVDKLLTWFFDSIFIYHVDYNNFDNEFNSVRSNINQMKSFASWDEFSSRDDAIEMVCKLSFPQAQMSVEEVALEILKHVSQQKDLQVSGQIIKEKEFADMGQRFEQATKEKFVFILTKTTVDTDTRDKIKEFFLAQLNALSERLTVSLSKKMNGFGKLIKGYLFRVSEQEGI